MREAVRGFGLLTIGNEILDGRVTDRHFEYASSLLASRNLDLAYCMVLPDDIAVISTHISWAMDQPEPFFSCGGIGSTPDDLTRQAAAEAVRVDIERHPEGESILRNRWGKEATDARLRMIDFPAGSVLIPNPVNQVPGFRIANGHFLPGFPEMAHPMMEWILDNWYEIGQEKAAEKLVLTDVREADIVDVMKAFLAGHDDVSFSSLPKYTETGCELHLGLRGAPAAVKAGIEDLAAMLENGGCNS
jgi:molybdopterin-biosynthesis enzyme MoeA-like protein